MIARSPYTAYCLLEIAEVVWDKMIGNYSTVDPKLLGQGISKSDLLKKNHNVSEQGRRVVEEDLGEALLSTFPAEDEHTLSFGRQVYVLLVVD